MNALNNMAGASSELALNERIYAKARYIAQLVQGSQILEAAAVDAAGYERIIENAARMLREGDPRKIWAED